MHESFCDGAGADLIQLRAKKSSVTRKSDGWRKLDSANYAGGERWFGHQRPPGNRSPEEVGADLCHLGNQEDFRMRDISTAQRVRSPEVRSQNRPQHSRAGTSPTSSGGGCGLHCNWSCVCDGHQTDGQAGDTGRYVRWAAEHVKVPWFAIGGINLQNLDEVLAAGARRICVVSAILDAENVAKACAEFRRRLETVGKNK